MSKKIESYLEALAKGQEALLARIEKIEEEKTTIRQGANVKAPKITLDDYKGYDIDLGTWTDKKGNTHDMYYLTKDGQRQKGYGVRKSLPLLLLAEKALKLAQKLNA